MNDPIDVATLRAIGGIVGVLLVAILARLEKYGHRIVKLETQLNNGVVANVKEIRSMVTKHIEGEEGRIAYELAKYLYRDPRKRTRSGDRFPRQAED